MAKIVGFNLNKISLEREKEIKGKIEIKSNLDITGVSKEDIELSKDSDILSFGFDYSINYEPKIAELVFHGDVLVMFPTNEGKEILKKWKKKEIGENIKIIVYNMIFAKCNIRALQLEEDLNLPPHIPMPKLMPKQSNSYTG